jgi:predicted PhzF superfamily epimerase YddE/YHI9
MTGSRSTRVDFVSRFFAPGAGIGEDPVAGERVRLGGQAVTVLRGELLVG